MIKNFTLFFPALLFYSTTIAQKTDTLRKYLDEQLAFTNKAHMKYPGIAFTKDNSWVLVCVYPHGDLLVTANYKGKDMKVKYGPFAFYHPGKVKAMEGYYVNNVQQGVWRYWYTNGQLRDSGLVVNNHLSGLWKSWYDNGQLAAESTYPDADSIGEPVFNSSVNSRKLSLFIGDTVISNKIGKWVSWYNNGMQKDSGVFKNNLKEGAWYTWYPNGQLESNGSYKNDRQEGEWTYFREDGTVSTKETYKEGKLHAMACYNEQGVFTDSFCSILKPPVVLTDRYVDFETYALNNIKWPEDLTDKTISGIVSVQFTITKEGQLTNFAITRSPHELLSKEVERFIHSLPAWSPAISHNRPIEFEMSYEFPFNM